MPWRTQLCARLPGEIAAVLRALDAREAQQLEEIRLYQGFPCELVIAGKRTQTDVLCRMDELLAALSAHALYSCESQMAMGYIPLPGGHRAGVCGHMVKGEDGTWHMAQVSSVCIRISRLIDGASRAVRPFLLDHGGVPGRVLLLGAPGCGKTTVLRDALLWLSREAGLHVAAADEREELFAGMGEKRPAQLDVLSGMDKAQAFSLLLRAMSPQVLAADELGHAGDDEAVLDAARCGTGLLVTAHAGGMEDALRRPVLRRLLEEGVFDWHVLLGRHGSVLAVWDRQGKSREERTYGQLGCGADGDDCRQRAGLSARGW